MKDISVWWSSADWQQIAQKVLGRLGEGHGLMLFSVLVTLILATIITFVQARTVPRSFGGLWQHILPRGTVTHPSTRADYLFWLSKRFMMPPLVAVLGISAFTTGHVTYSLLSGVLGLRPPSTHPAGFWALCAFTLTMFVVYDFSNYSFHVLQHRIPVLWDFHKVHHSAQRMVGVTKDRVHPVDEIMSRWWSGMIMGPFYAVWLYFVLDPVELTVFGLNAYALANTVIMMDFVRHTHLKLSYGMWLNSIFLCPHYHQVHHSVDPRHYDRNFGQVLAIWDWMFGTLHRPEHNEDFVFGLADNEHDQYQSLLRLYAVPFVKLFQRWKGGEVASAAASQLSRQNLLGEPDPKSGLKTLSAP